MARVVWPDEVIAQLDDIAAVIALDNPAAARRVVARLIALGESLVDFPHRGRPASANTRKMTGVPPYRLRYRAHGNTVVIVNIRHGRRRPLP